MLTDRDFPNPMFERPLPDGADMTKEQKQNEFAYLFNDFSLQQRLKQRRGAEVTFWRNRGLFEFALEASGDLRRVRVA